MTLRTNSACIFFSFNTTKFFPLSVEGVLFSFLRHGGGHVELLNICLVTKKT